MNGLIVALMMAGGITPPPSPVPPEVHLSDISRFPSYSTVSINLRFIDAHREWLDRQRPLTRADAGNLEALQADMYWRWYIWDDMRIIHETNSKEAKLAVLNRLREWIEPEHYDRGELPPPCPVWLWNVHGD